ncbi:AP-4 complex accessory subunit RUSC2 [Erpetoichthys calabaricus]|uniref:AP-4 complex accessory subunit RUSC2 n=1 Tax=Erpetoichthys calabaricus TaxID=27687 RepID=UPI002234D3CF|nr:AP-4 complex accessory subunit RUSC2 [Erpetoichthys calabaricus]
MDSPLKLSGETLIVHHIPLVHCQIADRQCCSSIKRANPFCQPDLGLTRTTSLPERDVLLKEDLVYSSLIKASSSGGGDSKLIDSSSFSSSYNLVETKVKEYAGKGNHKQRYNPFLLNAKDKKQFDGYQEDSSFHLHVNSNTNTDKHSSFHFTPHSFLLHENMETSLRSATAISHRLGAAEGRESVGCNLMMNNPNCCNTKTMERLVECLDLSGHHCQQRNGSSGSTLSMDCGEQEWNSSPPEEDDQLREDQQSHPCSCCSSMDFNHPPSSANRCRCCFYSFSDPSEINDEQMGYVSDSSCNSSDGVLVNFSTIYNKMKNDVPSKSLNMNSEDQSCESSIGSHSEPGVAFYLDLHTSPLESQGGCSQGLGGFSSGFDHTSNYQQSPDTLDANCNSYHLNCEAGPGLSDGSDVTSCFQSQARLVVATQNYYKLVTCDLSSQSSPSPAGSSIASCSDEHNKSSPSQPTEYYLFQKPEDNEQGKWFEQQGDSKDDETIEDQMAHSVIEGQVYINVSPPNMHSTGRPRSRSYDRHLHKSPSPRLGSLERMMSCPVKLSESSSHFSHHSSPPRRVTSFAEIARSKIRSNSLNGSSPPLRKSSDSSSQDITPVSDIQLCMGECHSLPPMPLLHCYNQGNYDLESAAGGSPLHRFIDKESPQPPVMSAEPSLEVRTKAEGGSISDGRAIIRYSKEQRPTTLPIQPFVFQHQLSKPHAKLRPLLSDYISQMYNRPIGQPASDSVMQREDKEDGVKKTSPDSVRLSPLGSYSPVHNGDSSPETCSTCTPTPDRSSKPPRSRSCPVSASLLPIKVSPEARQFGKANAYHNGDQCKENPCSQKIQQGGLIDSPTKEQPSLSEKVSGYCLHETARPAFSPSAFNSLSQLNPQQKYIKSEGIKEAYRQSSIPVRPANGNMDLWFELHAVSQHGPLGIRGFRTSGFRTSGDAGHPLLKILPITINPEIKEHSTQTWNTVFLLYFHFLFLLCLFFFVCWSYFQPIAHHLSPQALKWREYRRKNPLGLERSVAVPLLGSVDSRRPENRVTRRNVFDFPPLMNHGHSKLNGQSMKQLQNYYSDLFPDYFSLTEKPPEEFCLSPDAATESISIDIVQKRELVKAMNTAVDLIVAHFGNSRDPSVKAKLGNSSVSPNVGHLILKYLCPAIHAVLSDGLKPFILDVIIGQRRNVPWSVVEASAQLGPSTKLLYSLYGKISQYSELTSHTMRFNAFIFGLLNMKSVEFWFNHLYNCEDVVTTHYHQWGFLPLSQGVCHLLFEELLLLLQPLSLLPFDLDLLFEHRLLQKSHDHFRRKEQLCLAGQGLEQSVRSTFQLMRGWGVGSVREVVDAHKERKGRNNSFVGIKAETKAVHGVFFNGEKDKCKGIARTEVDTLREIEPDLTYLRERSKVMALERKAGEENGVRPKDRNAGWWYQLMQSSQVYMNNSSESSRFVKSEKRKKTNGCGQPSLTTVEEVTDRQIHPPPREGVVEGAEAGPNANIEKDKGSGVVFTEKGKASWMGSPPESVLNDLKKSKEKEFVKQENKIPAVHMHVNQELLAQRIRWGRLFGADLSTSHKRENLEHRTSRGTKSRLPSGWLNLEKSVLDFMTITVGTGKQKNKTFPCSEAQHYVELQDHVAKQEIYWEVRALCHHIATEPGQLSFKKGDVLQVLGKADHEWLHCRLGSLSGLVPIIYVTLPEEQDS